MRMLTHFLNFAAAAIANLCSDSDNLLEALRTGAHWRDEMNLSRQFRAARDRRSPSFVNGDEDEDALNLSQNDISFEDLSETLVDADDLPIACESAQPEPTKHPDAHPLLPASSSDLWLELADIDTLLSCYSVIRSFAFILRLSPFTFKELCRDITYQNSTTLIDEMHISILRTLHLYPPVLDEGDGTLFQGEEVSYNVTEGVLLYTQDQTFRFLDSLTWPEFLRKWMYARGNSGESEANDFQCGCEYFQLSTRLKIDILNVICEDLLDSWIIRREVQNREQMLDYLLSSEKQEVSEKNRMTKSADASKSTDDIHGLPEAYDHLYIREGLDSLELDVCDVTGVGGTLICCDGCPASYLAKSVGMKRVGDDSQKWFCEECRVGGQIRSHRFLHRATSALRWSSLPSFSIIGQNGSGLRCFTAYGRVFVGKGKDLYAYYSTTEKVDELISFFKTTRLSEGSDASALDQDEDEPRSPDAESDEDSDSDDESTWDAELVLKRKKKAIIEQMEFRSVVESKQSCSNEYVNKYKDAMSLADVTVLYNKGKEKERKKADASVSRKWGNWPKSQDCQCDGNAALSAVASYLLQTEKCLYGLVDGLFLKPCARQEWIEWVKQGDEVSELSKAALILESAIRPSALLRMWFDGTDKKIAGRGRGGGRKGKDSKKDNREDVDWSELRDAGILEDVSIQGNTSVEDEDDSKQYLVWISGRQVMPLNVNLTRKSLRQLVLTAGETEVRGMMYRGPCAVPSARLVWIRDILDARTTAQLALQLRVFDESLRADIFRKPVPPCDVSIHSNVVERVVGKREVGSGYVQYEVKMFGDDANTEWMSQENTPIFCIREYEAEFRKAAEAEAKKIWWKDFDFHPGVSVEVEFENQWYQGYVVECFDERNSLTEEHDLGDVEWEDGVGVVRVHYIGGLDEEDEYIRKDDDRLREDKKSESRMLKERIRRSLEDRKLRKISDKELRMQTRLALYEERIRLREFDYLARGRDIEKVKEKEKKEQEKLEKMRQREQREREKQGKIRDRESDREARIRERREEQDKKKEEQKLIKKAARERLRIEQGKKGWWKDFNWCVGVMVEMEWDNEWWDAIVIKVLPAKSDNADYAEGDLVSQGDLATMASQRNETGTDGSFIARQNGIAIEEDTGVDKEAAEMQNGVPRKADETEGWEAAVGYMVKKCQGPRIYYPKDWPEEGVYICFEDDRPVDIARKHRVNLERLVRNNKKAYPGLSKTSALKAGTALKLPLPLDIRIGSTPPPPPDPLGVGIVLIHYVGGDENETEWVFRSSRRMRPSADKLWNAVAVEAAEEMMSVLAPDPGSWKKHCSRVLKRVRKSDKSWPFWEPVDPAKDGLDDYYDIIAKPMCLDTVEASLNADQYQTADEFANDMRLIFENAMLYNPPESRYHHLAQKVLDIFNDLWSSGHHGNNWGQPFGAAPGDFVSQLKESNVAAITPASNRKKMKRQSTEKEQLKSGEKGKRSSADDVASQMQEVAGEDAATEAKFGGEKSIAFMDRRLTSNSRTHLKGLLETLMQNELAKAFLEPVAVLDAPDYYEIIKKPMDLGTLRDMLLSRRCNTPASFERNMRLIFDNAREYNGEDDQVSKAANALERMFERKWTKILPILQSERLSLENSRVSKSDGTPEEDLAASTLDNKKDTQKNLGKTQGLKRGRQVDISSPASISRPIKSRKTKPSEVDNLIPEDNLGDQVMGASYSQQTCASESEKKKKKGGGNTSRRSEADVADAVQRKHAVKATNLEACESSDVGLEHVVLSDCLSMLDRLLSAKGGNYFAEPVDAEALGLPDYHEIIKEPMDFSTIRERLLSGYYCVRRKGKAAQTFGEQDGVRMREAFGRDVRKVLDNAILYNPESDPVYKAAVSILEFFNSSWPYFSPALDNPPIKKEKKKSVASIDHSAPPETKKQKNPKWLQKCKNELSELMTNPNAECFLKPINAKDLRLKDYHRIIQRPMDLETIKDALEGGSISSYEEFNDMVDLVCSNAILYFGPEHAMHVAARNLLSSRKAEPSQANKVEVVPSQKTINADSRVKAGPKSAQKEKRPLDPGPKEEPAAAAAAPECLEIGTPVEMLFGDGVWYKGEIQRFSARSGLYTIVFPDGDVQTFKLPDSDVRILGFGALSRKDSQLMSPHANGNRRTQPGTSEKKSEQSQEASDHPAESAISRNTPSSRKKTASNLGDSQQTPDIGSKSTKQESHSTPTAVKSTPKEQRRPDSSAKELGACGGESVPECLAIGTPVEMLFGDGVWYEGVVERFSARSGLHTIVFPDGDVQTFKLPDNDVRVLDQSRQASSTAGKGKNPDSEAKSKTPSSSKRSKEKESRVDGDSEASEAKKRASAHGAGEERQQVNRRQSNESNETHGRSHENKEKSNCKASDGARSGGKEFEQAALRVKKQAAEPQEDKQDDKSGNVETCESGGQNMEHVVLSDCLSMLDRLLSARGGDYFAEPVDAEALGLPDYHEIIKEPMDFSTIRERLLSGYYCVRRKGKAAQTFGEQDGVRMREAFGRDVRKVLDNAILYNPESDRVYKAAVSILNIFQAHWPTGSAAEHPAKSPIDTASSTTPRVAAELATSSTHASNARHARKSGGRGSANADSEGECTEESEPARAGGAEDGTAQSLLVSSTSVLVSSHEDSTADLGDSGKGAVGDVCDGDFDDAAAEERPRRRQRKGGR